MDKTSEEGAAVVNDSCASREEQGGHSSENGKYMELDGQSSVSAQSAAVEQDRPAVQSSEGDLPASGKQSTSGEQSTVAERVVDGKEDGGSEDEVLIERIKLALRQIYDPEISVNIYDLGLIYQIRIDEGPTAFIQMTMTAPNCPMAEDVVDQVYLTLRDVPGIKDVKVDLVFEPEWTQKMMSEEALLELGLL